MGPPSTARTATRSILPPANSATCSASGNSMSLLDVLGDDLLRADRVVHREAVLLEELRWLSNQVERMRAMRVGMLKTRVGHLRGDEVRLVARGHREEHVGVGRARLGQDLGLGGVAHDRAQVELVLQVLQALRARVDDGDVVLLRDQALGHAGADLAGAEDEDLQGGGGIVGWTAQILRRAGRWASPKGR